MVAGFWDITSVSPASCQTLHLYDLSPAPLQLLFLIVLLQFFFKKKKKKISIVINAKEYMYLHISEYRYLHVLDFMCVSCEFMSLISQKP